jgi:D-alanine-D-alanine ligase
MRQIPSLSKATAPTKTKLLYLAPYAPDFPDFEVKPYNADGGYPKYHYNIYHALKKIGYQVWSTSKPYAIQFASGNVDYVFSLMNRMPILNSEIFISAYCEFARISYLGAPPNIRALAEDKFLTKLVAQSIGVPVALGLPFAAGGVWPKEAPFTGPFFVKDRFGAGSRGISEQNICDKWHEAKQRAYEMVDGGDSVIVEQFCPGIDVTVSVLGGAKPIILGFVQPNSDKIGSILTEDLKLHDHLGYKLIDVGTMEEAFDGDIQHIWSAFGPIDYFRADYRVDFESKQRRLLEINICCYLGNGGAICLAAKQHGYSQLDVLEHVIEYSLERQKLLRKQCEWIL